MGYMPKKAREAMYSLPKLKTKYAAKRAAMMRHANRPAGRQYKKWARVLLHLRCKMLHLRPLVAP